MKEKITTDIKEIFNQGRKWVSLEIEYVKLTAAEKFTVLLSTLVLGLALFLIGLVLLIVLAILMITVFKIFLSAWLACLCVAGILILFMLLLYMLRKQLLMNPIAKFITRLFLDPEKSGSEKAKS